VINKSDILSNMSVASANAVRACAGERTITDYNGPLVALYNDTTFGYWENFDTYIIRRAPKFTIAQVNMFKFRKSPPSVVALTQWMITCIVDSSQFSLEGYKRSIESFNNNPNCVEMAKDFEAIAERDGESGDYKNQFLPYRVWSNLSDATREYLRATERMLNQDIELEADANGWKMSIFSDTGAGDGKRIDVYIPQKGLVNNPIRIVTDEPVTVERNS